MPTARKQVRIADSDSTNDIALFNPAANVKPRLVALWASTDNSAAGTLKIGTGSKYMRFPFAIGGTISLPYNPAGYMEWDFDITVNATMLAALASGKILEVNATFE